MSKENEIIAVVADSSDLDTIRVLKDGNGVYHVESRGEIRHSPCTAEDVIRALAHYAQSIQFELDRKKGW